MSTRKKHDAPAVPKANATGRPLVENMNGLVFGKKGYGKSTWTEDVLTAACRRVIFVDTLLKDYTRGTIYTNFQEFLAAVSRYHSAGDFRAIVRCPGMERLVFDLFKFNNKHGRALVQNCVLVVEEITTYCNSNFIEPALMDHLQYGRHAQNSLIGVARGPYEVNPHLRRQADFIVAFRQTDERDLKYFRELGAAQNVEKLRTLERGEALLMAGDPDELAAFIKKGA